MDIRVIINSLLIIFVIHIIILNINSEYNFGNKKNIEKFDTQSSNSKESSMNFLTSNNSDTSNEEFKKKLLKYIQQDETPKETTFDKKNLNSVEASNYFLSNNNEPNFESNVADIKKFYTINYDNLDETQLKSTSLETLKTIDKINDVVTIDTQSKQPCNVKEYGRVSTLTPDYWSYKDELPMNGGKMNGIYGFDNLESQFAVYNPNKLNLQSVSNDKFNNIPHDDLRKPIIYEN
jgi:hypothetical protein